MVNWEARNNAEFIKEAKILQQEYCDLLGDRRWDVIKKSCFSILRRKVGFGKYGPPSMVPSPVNMETGYKRAELLVIDKICNQLIENMSFALNDIHFACIFVIIKDNADDKRYSIPVFKAKRANQSTGVFVDTEARKYSDWNDYLNNNTLPDCLYCSPEHGYYELNGKNVRIIFGESPACHPLQRVVGAMDVAALAVSVAATTVGVAALCAIPIAGPIMAATVIAGVTTSAYGVTRSTMALADRAAHSQSIAITDPEAAGYWFSIVGSSLGFAQGRMLQSMTQAARAGEVMGKAGRIAFMVVQTGSLTVNGLGIVHGLAIIINKTEKNELTVLDLFQFSASLLFFTNSALNIKTASAIIKDVQHDVIRSHRAGLSRDATKLFNKQTGRLRGPDEMYGNAKVVKQLNNIENSKDLYEMMADKNVASNKVKLTPDGFKGLLEVNKNLKIHPYKLLEIPPAARQEIFNATKNYQTGLLNKDQFNNNMKIHCRNYRIAFESMREDTIQKLCKIYGKQRISDIVVGDKKLFVNTSPHEVDRLRVVLENTVLNNKTVMEKATEFARLKGCNTPNDFITYAEYFVADLNETVKSYEASYQRDLAIAKKQPGFKQVKFDESRGIKNIKRVAFHKQKAMDEFKTIEGYKRLNARYVNLKSKVAPLNQKCQPGFFSDDAATYHYLKHKDFGGLGELTTDQYFKLAEEVVGNRTNRTNAMLSQDGSCTMITYLEPQRGVRAIKIDRNSGGNGIATVMYDTKVLARD